ncbi:MATE family efflux transporter [Sinomicrobium weinanense]|uniref:Multidrug-efflux transporter n=1 Tax=Sinomicrobium weinanense TaxID=2842200 RepID=A0A926Q2B7_9FLAO|nr:MATE family efflux transporter [Sinomicrobium weinanense]MBC9794515.1 MATE family efflux transporter [Sinomicrobium weinanense]MBU3124422.1 MATE family efflux transporter [Sinomicrobium weinanense]
MPAKIQSLFGLFKTAVRGTEKDFTSGNVARATFLLSFPSMMELALESLFVMVDLLFISSLGESAVTISGITNSVIILFHSVAVGLGIAATAIISRRVGEKKGREATSAAVQAIYSGVVVALLFSGTGMVFHKNILKFAGASENMVLEGSSYTTIMFGSVLFMVLRVLMNAIFRGAGQAAMAMRSLLLCNAINAVLCAVLIFGPDPFPALGLPGAAWATGFANLAAVLYQYIYLRRDQSVLSFDKQQWKPVIAVMKKLWRLGAAGTAQYLVPASSRFLMIAVVSLLGESALAGYVIANRIILFTALPAWGIANAAGVLTGQNLGAGQPERAARSVWITGIFNMAFLSAIALALLLFTDSVASLFTDDPSVAKNTVLYLRYMAIAYLFFGYTMVISRSLNAAGQINTVTLLYILTFYIVQLPAAYILAILLNGGPKGIFIAIVSSEVILALCCIAVFRTEKWKSIKL